VVRRREIGRAARANDHADAFAEISLAHGQADGRGSMR
jgi:hypothetical protein